MGSSFIDGNRSVSDAARVMPPRSCTRCRTALGRTTRITQPFLGFLLGHGCKLLESTLAMGKVRRMVAPLIIRYQLERPLGVKDRPGQHARQQQPHLIERQRHRSVFPLQSYPNQEMVRQHYHYHMMLPPLPTSHLIVFHPDFAFSLLKRQFHWPAHPQKARQFRLRRRFGRIAHVIAHITGVCHVPTYDQPQTRTWQSVARFIATSLTIGPLLPSLMVVRFQALLGNRLARKST